MSEIPDIIIEEWAITIKRMRTRLGLSQSKFAKVVGRLTRTIQAWEQGENTPHAMIQGLVREKCAKAERRKS